MEEILGVSEETSYDRYKGQRLLVLRQLRNDHPKTDSYVKLTRPVKEAFLALRLAEDDKAIFRINSSEEWADFYRSNRQAKVLIIGTRQ